MSNTQAEREMLEEAAKACVLDGYQWCEAWKCMAFWAGEIDGFDRSTCWNPKRGDGDCARMEAALGIGVRGNSKIAYMRRLKERKALGVGCISRTTAETSRQRAD